MSKNVKGEYCDVQVVEGEYKGKSGYVVTEDRRELYINTNDGEQIEVPHADCVRWYPYPGKWLRPK